MNCMKASTVATSFIRASRCGTAQNSAAGAWNSRSTPAGRQHQHADPETGRDKLTGDLANPQWARHRSRHVLGRHGRRHREHRHSGTSLQPGINGKVDADTMNGSIAGDFGEFRLPQRRRNWRGGGVPPARGGAAVPAAPAAPGSTTDATGADPVLSIRGWRVPRQAEFKQDGTKITGIFSGPAGDVTLQGMTRPL
jgi:hypothetical protein